jgi:hypothetical protein
MNNPYSSEELSILREALNVITIKGSDAIKIATLQVKLEDNIRQLQQPEPEEPEKTTKTRGSK